MKILDSDRALEELMAGNRRYAAGRPISADQTAEYRIEIARGQNPIASIIGCSDSRVPPEIIFDQGLGDLFVVRVAGNVLDDVVIGSVEYAVEYLNVHLAIVLGHKRCGAVEAAVRGGAFPGHVGSLARAIRPAMDKARS